MTHDANGRPAVALKDMTDAVPDPEHRRELPVAVRINGSFFVVRSVEIDGEYVALTVEKTDDQGGDVRLMTRNDRDEPDTEEWRDKR